MPMSMTMPEGSVALVTGGSRGIGRATCLTLAECGASVVVNYQNNEIAAKEVVEEAISYGVEALAIKADVTDETAMRAMFRTVRKQFGRLDVMVANAGVIEDGLASTMSTRRFDKVVAVNLRGTFLACKEASRLMLDRKAGSIITVGSTPGMAGVPGQVNYCASKGGVLALTKALADELAPLGIRANVVSPGCIETDMTHAASANSEPERRERYLQHIPIGRFGDPQDVAHTIVFLASPLASYITGTCVYVDGGLIV